MTLCDRTGLKQGERGEIQVFECFACDGTGLAREDEFSEWEDCCDCDGKGEFVVEKLPPPPDAQPGYTYRRDVKGACLTPKRKQ